MTCIKYPTCKKIDVLADRDILDFQFADGVKQICGNCPDNEVKENENAKS